MPCGPCTAARFQPSHRLSLLSRSWVLPSVVLRSCTDDGTASRAHVAQVRATWTHIRVRFTSPVVSVGEAHRLDARRDQMRATLDVRQRCPLTGHNAGNVNLPLALRVASMAGTLSRPCVDACDHRETRCLRARANRGRGEWANPLSPPHIYGPPPRQEMAQRAPTCTHSAVRPGRVPRRGIAGQLRGRHTPQGTA